MTKKRPSRAKTTRSITKTRLSAKSKAASRAKRAGKKATTKRSTVPQSKLAAKVVWPGLPPGYLDRGR